VVAAEVAVVVVIEETEEGMIEATEIEEAMIVVNVAVAATNDIPQVGLVLVPIPLVPDPIPQLLVNIPRIEDEIEKKIAVVVRKRRKDEIAMLRRVLVRLLPIKKALGREERNVFQVF
jgi:hypothetical protein